MDLIIKNKIYNLIKNQYYPTHFFLIIFKKVNFFNKKKILNLIILLIELKILINKPIKDFEKE